MNRQKNPRLIISTATAAQKLEAEKVCMEYVKKMVTHKQEFIVDDNCDVRDILTASRTLDKGYARDLVLITYGRIMNSIRGL